MSHVSPALFFSSFSSLSRLRLIQYERPDFVGAPTHIVSDVKVRNARRSVTQEPGVDRPSVAIQDPLSRSTTPRHKANLTLKPRRIR